MTAKDLTSTTETLQIVKKIESFEPYVTAWTNDWNYDIPKKAIRDSLFLVLKSIQSSNNADILLLQGLLWHYLYQLEFEQGFYKAESISTRAIKLYPDKPECLWLRGVNLVRSGRISSGFKILDKLRISDAIKNPNFINDYIQLSAACFLPKINFKVDKDITKTIRQPDINGYVQPKESIPISEKWKIHDNPRKISGPAINFSATYSLLEHHPLIFSSLIPQNGLTLKVNIDSTIENRIITPLAITPNTSVSESPLEISITVYRKPQNISLNEFLYFFVNDKFETVKTKKELTELKAVSLRCYNRGFFRDDQGEYFACIAFDKVIYPAKNGVFFQPVNNKNKDYMPVRYLITLKTNRTVEYKAEEILQQILYRFSSSIRY